METQKKTTGGRLPGKSVRKVSRVTAGGGVLLLAWLAFMLFRSGIGGTGQSVDGDGEGDAERASRPPLASNAAPGFRTGEGLPSASEESDNGLTADEQRIAAAQVLTVLITEHDYMIQMPSDSELIYRPVELDRLVEMAAETQGDSNGIRVRILRRDSARASAEEQLKLDLSRRGIGSDAVHMSEQFVP